eukprot:NODE_102_length_19640_cov_1.308735.p14 type:complete len:104 gc:universal NODE_102_length_19640_cov_1.308735:6065-6376(+)
MSDSIHPEDLRIKRKMWLSRTNWRKQENLKMYHFLAYVAWHFLREAWLYFLAQFIWKSQQTSQVLHLYFGLVSKIIPGHTKCISNLKLWPLSTSRKFLNICHL